MRIDNSTEQIEKKKLSALQRYWREPTLHFLFLALLIFVVVEINSPELENNLEINRVEIEARVLMLELSSGQQATTEQRQAIERAYIEEQILVAEARQLGLHNDARIDDMLAQKMKHVLSADVIQPSEQELADYYQTNASRYQSEPSVNVAELILDIKDSDTAELNTLLNNSGPIDAVASLSPTPLDFLPALSQTDISILFDEDFSNQVFAAEVGQWLGPFASNRGQHWLLLRGKTTTELPALADIRDRVRLDWIAEEEENKLQGEIDKLRQQYSISIIEPDALH